MRTPHDAGEKGCQPRLQSSQQRGIAEIGPCAGLAVGRTQEGDPCPKRFRLSGPRQSRKAHRADAGEHRRDDGITGGRCQRALLQHQRPEPAFGLGFHRFGAGIPGDGFDRLDRFREIRFDLGEGQGCGQEDPRLAPVAVERRDGEEVFARQRIGLGEARAVAVGEAILAKAAAPLRDAVGIGQGDDGADGAALRVPVERNTQLLAPKDSSLEVRRGLMKL
jgi:hypothetical protein